MSSTLKRIPSTNVFDQGPQETCYAHAITRLILNAIRQTIPDHFYPLEENDECDEYYNFQNMLNFFADKRNVCSEKSLNNVMMYIYIYKILTKKFGCTGYYTEIALQWFNRKIIREKSVDGKFIFGDRRFIYDTLKTFKGLNLTHIDRIEGIVNDFLKQNVEFYVIPYQIFPDLSEYADLLGDTNLSAEDDFSDETVLNKGEQLIKSVIDKGYYLLISGLGHVMTIVDYIDKSTVDGEFLLVIKNSYGKVNYIDQYGFEINNGIITVPLARAAKELHFDMLYYLIPKKRVIDEESGEKRGGRKTRRKSRKAKKTRKYRFKKKT